MNSRYQQMLVELDALSPSEWVSLLEHIAHRLQNHVGAPQADSPEEGDDTSRRHLPRLAQMIEWGLVVPMEDTLHVKDYAGQPALLLDASRVAYQGETMSINEWARAITGWKAVGVHVEAGLRRAALVNLSCGSLPTKPVMLV